MHVTSMHLVTGTLIIYCMIDLFVFSYSGILIGPVHIPSLSNNDRGSESLARVKYRLEKNRRLQHEMQMVFYPSMCSRKRSISLELEDGSNGSQV